MCAWEMRITQRGVLQRPVSPMSGVTSPHLLCLTVLEPTRAWRSKSAIFACDGGYGDKGNAWCACAML